ncbi:hypothetical protein [Desulfovibrio sp. X2]|uniref:hypothetical protein n=1 Tax=Desulfovibrio sp. X2 TaxID=941449 RepID=UPI0012688FF4|nr:hypothetical protein [Desulfovibrio sp. X2]
MKQETRRMPPVPGRDGFARAQAAPCPDMGWGGFLCAESAPGALAEVFPLGCVAGRVAAPDGIRIPPAHENV